MKLIIDIPEEEYEKNKLAKCDYHTLRMAIKNGTPLSDKPTNGEMLKAVFDCDVTELKRMTSSAGEILVGYEVFLYNHRPKKEGEFGFGTKQKFDGDMWWNAPYKENKG